MKIYCSTWVWVVLILFLTWYINSWKFFTTTQHTFPVWWRMFRRWLGANSSHIHVRCCLADITTKWYHRILICFKYTTGHFTGPYVLRIVSMVFNFFDNYPFMIINISMHTFYIYATLTNHIWPCTVQTYS